LKSLGASDFGVFATVGAAIATLGFFGTVLASATQRFMSYAEGQGDREAQKGIFNVSVILHFIIALMVGVALLIFGQFIFDGRLNIDPERISAAKAVYHFTIASTLLTIMTVPYEAVLNAHENMLYYAIVGIFEALLKLVAAIIVVYTLADKLIVYGAFMAGISFSVMCIMRIYCHRNYDECVFKPRIYFNKKIMKQMTSFAGWNFLGNISQMILNIGQVYVINIFFGTVINAAQGVAGQINGYLSVFSGSMMKALSPVIAKSEGAGNRNLMIQATMMGCKISFLLFSFFAIPALLEMPYILNIWLGVENVPVYAVIFCQFALLRTLLEQLYGAVNTSIAAHGNIKKYEIVSSIFCYFPLIASILLFRSGYPPHFLYLTYIGYTVIAAGITFFFAWYNYGFPALTFLKNTVLRCLCTFIITFLTTTVLIVSFDSSIYRLLMVFATGMVTFALTSWFIGLDKDEKKLTIQFLTPVFSKVFQKKNKTCFR